VLNPPPIPLFCPLPSILLSLLHCLVYSLSFNRQLIYRCAQIIWAVVEAFDRRWIVQLVSPMIQIWFGVSGRTLLRCIVNIACLKQYNSIVRLSGQDWAHLIVRFLRKMPQLITIILAFNMIRIQIYFLIVTFYDFRKLVHAARLDMKGSESSCMIQFAAIFIC